MQHVVQLIAVITLVSLTFGVGLQVDRERLLEVLRNVGLLSRALLANFVIVPILGVLMVKAFRLQPYVATGILLMAIAPVGRGVLVSVRKKGGSLGFAVALIFILSVLSVVTVPITAEWVLPVGVVGQISLGHFLLTLILFQLVPLLAGIVVGDRFPSAAATLERACNVLFAVAVIALLVLLTPKLAQSIATVYGSLGMLAMLCLVVLSLAAGWALGGPEREYRRVLGLATATRNTGLAAVVATQEIRAPEVMAAILTYLVIQFVVSAITGMYFVRTTDRAAA